jgi:hypothetical protein
MRAPSVVQVVMVELTGGSPRDTVGGAKERSKIFLLTTVAGKTFVGGAGAHGQSGV